MPIKFKSSWQPQRSQTCSLQFPIVLSEGMKLKEFVREISVKKIKLKSLQLADNNLELRALET